VEAFTGPCPSVALQRFEGIECHESEGDKSSSQSIRVERQ
jgi:hypothetical protein